MEIKLYYDQTVLFNFSKNSRIAKSPFKINWPLRDEEEEKRKKELKTMEDEGEKMTTA